MPFLTHNDLRIQQCTIPIARLPASFDGFRLVQISDLHFYEHTDPAYYNQVLEAVHALQPDIIALTGDIVHFGPDYVANAGDFLAHLNASVAKLAILGNHDYHDGAGSKNIAAMLAQANFDLLVNEHRVFERQPCGNSPDKKPHNQHQPDESKPGKRQTDRLWIAGLDDLWYGQPDIQKALHNIPNKTETTLMLAHNPLLFDPVAMAGLGQVDLMISGHTHAGHVYIPFLGPIYRRIFRMKYRYGLFEKNGCRLYVTSGVGSAAFYLKKQRIGFPRFRFNTRPEIALLKLTCG